MADVLRYTAFSDRPEGGNPAGVVLDAGGLAPEEMLAIAAEVGYSETAFVVGGDDSGLDVRYFSPEAEVPFCGHATVATAVALAERDGAGALRFRTPAGEVAVDVGGEDRLVATFTTVAPRVAPVDEDDVDRALAALRWRREELDPALPPRVAYAGAWHLVLAAASRERLRDLDYDFAALGALMAERDWTTVQLVFRESDTLYHARDPFPPGGVVEDPATGAAAAAFGAYLRDLGLIAPPARFSIRQGDDMGRPGVIAVEVPEGTRSGVRVGGRAVPLPA